MKEINSIIKNKRNSSIIREDIIRDDNLDTETKINESQQHNHVNHLSDKINSNMNSYNNNSLG